MNTHRAEEIVDSLGVIEVLYQGSPIWIEQISGDSVQIRDLNTQQRLEVPVNELVER
jgi:small acid-soluble spore protein H (minor)